MDGPSLAPDWIEGEPAIGSSLGTAFARLARRARVTWYLWLPAALLLASLLTVRKYRQPITYESTVVLRAFEGAVAVDGRAAVQMADLRTDVSVLAFTSERLLEIMRKHPAAFTDLKDDPDGSVTSFRDAMDVAFEENDFIEERQLSDPPRALLITVSFTAGTPTLAYTIVHELADLVVEQGQDGQKQLVERRQKAAVQAVRQASDELDGLIRSGLVASDPRLEAARGRLRVAQTTEVAAGLSAKGGGVSQVVRFDVVDPGREPPPVDRRAEVVKTFIQSVILCVLAAWLFAGAFDPRVLDEVDLAAIGSPILGRVPALPGGRPAEEEVRKRPT